MDFPAIEMWRSIVLAPGEEKFGRRDFYEYYREKFRICRLCGPASIAEIGVRWGYSAFAFLCAAPGASYTGFDLIGGGHGGVADDTFPRVAELLEQNFPGSKIDLIHADTRTLESLGGSFDFIHVDGNHSIMAVAHDLKIAFESLSPGGVLLVDDYDYIGGVKVATNGFVLGKRDKIEQFYTVESLRGEMVIRRKK